VNVGEDEENSLKDVEDKGIQCELDAINEEERKEAENN
jgi:hypothetical protein